MHKCTHTHTHTHTHTCAHTHKNKERRNFNVSQLYIIHQLTKHMNSMNNIKSLNLMVTKVLRPKQKRLKLVKQSATARVSHLIQVIMDIVMLAGKLFASSHLFTIEHHAGHTPNLSKHTQQKHFKILTTLKTSREHGVNERCIL